MDKLNEVLNSIKERLSNPFIFSFTITWLFWNWKIPLALIWYDAKTISMLGYNSFFDLVSCQIQISDSFLCPLLISAGITLAIPALKILFTLFQATLTRYGNVAFFWITKEGNISTERYIQLREKYIKLHQDLATVINSEGEFRRKFEERENEVRSLRSNTEVLNKLNDLVFLNGNWEMFNEANRSKYVVKINNSQVDITRLGGSVNSGSIVFFFRDIRNTERIFFQVFFSDTKKSTMDTLDTFDLFREGQGSFRGTLNRRQQISFIKVE